MRVAIVGAGYSGTIAAVEIARAAPGAEIVLIEKSGRFAAGRRLRHDLARPSAQRPGAQHERARRRARTISPPGRRAEGHGPDDYVPRRDYRRYLAGLLDGAAGRDPGDRRGGRGRGRGGAARLGRADRLRRRRCSPAAIIRRGCRRRSGRARSTIPWGAGRRGGGGARRRRAAASCSWSAPASPWSTWRSASRKRALPGRITRRLAARAGAAAACLAGGGAARPGAAGAARRAGPGGAGARALAGLGRRAEAAQHRLVAGPRARPSRGASCAICAPGGTSTATGSRRTVAARIEAMRDSGPARGGGGADRPGRGRDGDDRPARRRRASPALRGGRSTAPGRKAISSGSRIR